jgi:hypothetical protein
MKFRNRYIHASVLALFLLVVSSCKEQLDINEDPNNPKVAAPNLLLTSIQLDAVNVLEGSSVAGLNSVRGVNNGAGLNYDVHGFVGILASNDAFNLNNNSYNVSWNNFYSGPAKDLDGLIKSTEKAGNQPHYLGIAQVMKAYFFGLMVDMFGDIPYAAALNGDADESEINPAFEDDQVIYDDLIQLCDKAVENLNKTSATAVSGDLFYNGSPTSWRRLANTVKLRLLINSRRVRTTAAQEIQAIVTEGDYIQIADEDFIFKYNRIPTPEGRHPWYQRAYAQADNGFTYFLHQYMFEMLRDEDPRLPYYFKRQTSTILNPDDPTDRSTIPCSQTQGCRYAYWVLNPTVLKALYTDKGKEITDADRAYIAGFFGRDRGDISGVPQDVNQRTAPGSYPAAGQYDVAKSSTTGNVNTSGAGDGITPLITSWMVKFYLIEANLTLGVDLGQEPTALFESAMREQIAKVEKMGTESDANAEPMKAAAINKYINLYLEKFNAPTASNEVKLNVVLKQAWFSNLGNGFEIWNAFRRTGYPSDIQTPISRYRQFALRLPYPAQELSLNKNAPQNPPAFDGSEGVFWDVLKYKFQ